MSCIKFTFVFANLIGVVEKVLSVSVLFFMSASCGGHCAKLWPSTRRV